jgi:hypothetical protein
VKSKQFYQVFQSFSFLKYIKSYLAENKITEIDQQYFSSLSIKKYSNK